MRNGETPKEDAERHTRILHAVELREQNMSYPEIAKALGCSVSTAWEYVWTHLDRIDSEATEKLVRLRNKELARIERVVVRLWGAIDATDDGIAVKAATAFLKASERRAKLLGLDMPTKFEQKVSPIQPGEEAGVVREKLVAALAEVDRQLSEHKEMH